MQLTRCNASAAVLPSSSWSSSMIILPNSFDFPILPDVLGDHVQVSAPLVTACFCD